MTASNVIGRAGEDCQFAVDIDLDSGTCSKTGHPRSTLFSRDHGCTKNMGISDTRRGETRCVVVKQNVLCSKGGHIRSFGVKGASATTDEDKLSSKIRGVGRKRLASIVNDSAVFADGPKRQADIGHAFGSRQVAELTIRRVVDGVGAVSGEYGRLDIVDRSNSNNSNTICGR